MKSLLVLVLTAAACLAASEDISGLLTEAQRAYIRGDLAGAKKKFELVRELEPNNRIAVEYLRRILAEEQKELEKNGPPNTTEQSLKALVLPSVQFKDATLAETLEYLRQKAAQASGGKTTVNFVMQLDDTAKARKITLTLNNVPFSEVMRYIGDLAEVQFVYDRFAVVVKPKGPPEPAPAPAPGSEPPKIPGL